jgi:hypothetical protein
MPLPPDPAPPPTRERGPEPTRPHCDHPGLSDEEFRRKLSEAKWYHEARLAFELEWQRENPFD